MNCVFAIALLAAPERDRGGADNGRGGVRLRVNMLRPSDLKTLDGRPAGLETFRGRPLIMNFFASWCDPCRDEMPLINELAAKGARQGYNVLGIAVEDTRAAVTEFAKEAKLFISHRARSEQHCQARLPNLRPARDIFH